MTFDEIISTIPVSDGLITTDNKVDVALTLGGKPVQVINTSLRKYAPWVQSLTVGKANNVAPALSQLTWIDFLTTPMPLVIGNGNGFTVTLMLKVWSETDKFKDLNGKSYILPPTIFGGAWNTVTKKIVWNGVGLLSSIVPFNLDNPVHPWPYGNVYSGRGTICWGNVKYTDLISPADIFTLASRFLSSGFNTDLRYNDPATGLGKDGRVSAAGLPSIRFAEWIKLGAS